MRALRARIALGTRRCFKRIDTCAAEFAALTPYMYSTYESPGLGRIGMRDPSPARRNKIIILGGGPNRIGQGIEFDYCCCHAAYRAVGVRAIETIMVNCNPETVSTDYDTSDRLYFEPLTLRKTCWKSSRKEQSKRHTGRRDRAVRRPDTAEAGQHAGRDAGVPILGTSADAIDLAEDRKRFPGVAAKNWA